MKNLLIITLIIFQSCVSTRSVTVDRAIATEKRVRIKTIDENTYGYIKLIEKDGIVYGVKRISGLGLVELDLSYLDIIEVKYYSPGATAALVFVSFLAMIMIISALTCTGFCPF